jgi:ubiquinone/menaquinone biosynthesis C-methylase UbiE/biotin operon repressor
MIKTLRLLADSSRLRILLLLRSEELSVAELQEILTMGQSTISTHLSQLKQAGLVEDRRVGKNNLYRIKSEGSEGFLPELLVNVGQDIAEAPSDHAALRRVLHKRQDKARAFFDSVAGRLNRNYVPGKSWKSLAEALLRLLPPLTIADLGAGEGSFALLLAQRATRVIAVDSSARMIDVGRDEARRNGIANVDFRIGDMEDVPIGAGEVELAFFSQSLHHALHPERALQEAARILAPGGRVAVLDLARHRFEEARELYADEWLGFTESELETMLAHAGFTQIETTLVDKEAEPPYFQTLLAVGQKQGIGSGE